MKELEHGSDLKCVVPGYDPTPLVRSRRIWRYVALQLATTNQTILCC